MPSSAFELQRAAHQAMSESGAARELRLGNDSRIGKAREFLGALAPGSAILDVGCGDGIVVASLVGSYEFSGVDGDEVQVALARERGINAVVADITNLPFASASFDAAFAGEVIEHTFSPDKFLVEINRVLKPGGTLILTVPNIRTAVGVAMLLCGYAPMFAARYRSCHFRDFTERLIRAALRNNGFEVEGLRGSAFTVPGLGPRFPKLADLLHAWADHFIIRARKVREAVYDLRNEFE